MRSYLLLMVLMILLTVNACASSSESTSPLAGSAAPPESEYGTNIDCAEFQKLVDKTYDFRPSKLTDAQRTAKSAEMDIVWEKVKNDRRLIPCLVAALKAKNANQFFLFDGSTLLLSLDQSDDTKKLLIESYAKADLSDIMLQNWIAYPLRFGLDGLDTSAAGDAWLRAKDPFYYLPQHGTLRIEKPIGALAIFGSMDEKFATPALIAIVNQQDHPGRDIAAHLLVQQVTVESTAALRKLDQSGLASATKAEIVKYLDHPTFIEPRVGQPKVTREKFISAFEKLAQGDSEEFITLTVEVSDGERDAVAVLRPEDIPLVRKARRFFASTGTPHAPEWYKSFTDILMYLVRKPQTEGQKA